MSTDEELAEQYAAGKVECFEELFSRYRRPIFSYAYRMVSGWSMAEDACQEVFLRVHSGIGKYEPRSRFAAWIFTIAYNVCIDSLRKRKREQWLRIGLPRREPAATSRIDHELLENQQREIVLREIQKMGEKQLEELQQIDPERYKLRLDEMTLEQKSIYLGEQYRKEKSAEERARLKTELAALLDHLFDIRGKNKATEIRNLEAEIARLKEALAERERSKKEIVRARLDELLGEKTLPEW